MQVIRVGPVLTDEATAVLARPLADRLLNKPRVWLAVSDGRTPWPALEHAASNVWIVAGADKASMVERLLQADTGIPASRVPHDRTVLATNASHTGESP